MQTIDRFLDRVERRLSQRVNSEPRRLREEAWDRDLAQERKLARGEAFEDALKLLVNPRFDRMAQEAIDDIKSRYTQKIANIAWAIIESDLLKTPVRARFGFISSPHLRILGAKAEWVPPSAINLSYAGCDHTIALEAKDDSAADAANGLVENNRMLGPSEADD